jgi:predicted transcriptional regulator
MTKVLTVRLPDDLAEQLAVASLIFRAPQAMLVRGAVEEFLLRRYANPTFRDEAEALAVRMVQRVSDKSPPPP